MNNQSNFRTYKTSDRNKYVQQLRVDEIEASLPEMSTTEIDDDLREVRSLLHNISTTDVQLRTSALDIMRLFTSELESRVEQHKVANGIDDATLTRKHLDDARTKREAQQAQYDATKLHREQASYNAMDFHCKEDYRSKYGDPNER